MKHISMQISFDVPDDYVFEDGYKLMDDANRYDWDCQVIWTKEIEK